MVNILEDRQQGTLKVLAKSGLRKSNWQCVRSWQYSLAIAYAILLYTDVIRHFLDATDFNTATEGMVTVGIHICGVILAFPVVGSRVSGKKIFASLLLLLAGVTDFDWFMVGSYPRDDALHVKAFVLERATMERKHLVSITRIFRKRLENLSLRLNVTLILLIPILIAKVYFAVFPEFYTCTVTDVLRIVIIFFCFYQAVASCASQENAVFDYLKAANFQDYFEVCVRDPEFNSTLQMDFTFYISLTCKTLSLIYRIYSIIVYFSMSIVFGIAHVIFLLLSSAVHQLYYRPVYENPTTGIETWPNDILEAWARIFFLRAHRICERGFQAQMKIGLIWIVVLLVQHLTPLYALTELYTVVYSINRTLENATSNNQNFTSCPASNYYFIRSCLVGMKPDLTFLVMNHSFYDIFTDETLVFTILFAVSVASHILNLLYLSANDQNDDRFPSFLAADIWCSVFLRKDWETETRSSIERMLVLSLLDARKFKKLSRRFRFCRSYKPMLGIEWRTYAVLEASKAPALPDINFMRLNMLDNNPRRDYFEPLVEHIYQISGSDTYILKRLAYLLIDQFELKMSMMTSRRLTETRNMLKYNSSD